MKQIKSPTILQALFPIIFLVVLLTINVSVFGDDALSRSLLDDEQEMRFERMMQRKKMMEKNKIMGRNSRL